MNITKQEVAANHLKLIVHLDPSDYSTQVDSEIKNLSRKISIDGFRPGKVPAGITRKLYGNSILADELNKILSESLKEYIQSNQLKVFGQPLPFEAARQQIDVLQPQTYAFGFELGIMPEFELPSMVGRKFERKKLAVTEAMVNEEVERLRARYGEREYPETGGEEDILAGKFEELDEKGEVKTEGVSATTSFALKIIKEEETKKKLMAAKKDDKVELNIFEAFDNDKEMIIHHLLHTDHETAEKMNPHFRFQVTNIIRVKPAELNQELFDRIYGEGKVSSSVEMKTRIENEMNREFENFANNKVSQQIRESLLAETAITLPLEFLRRLLDESREDGDQPMDDARFEASLKQVQWDLISSQLIDKNQLLATEEEVRNEAQKDILNYFGGSAAYLAENPDSMNQLAESILKDPKNHSRLEARVLNEKLMALLLSQIATVDLPVSEHEFFHH